MTELGSQRGWRLTFTEDATFFSPGTLAQFDLVVWLNTSGDVLDANQQAAFEAFIEDGGGYAGVHAAGDTEHDWPWYGELLGARFSKHPTVQPATLRVSSLHAATLDLPDPWHRSDEWYDFKPNPWDKAGLVVLLSVDETSYDGGGMGPDHPVSWTHEFGGGRSFYTALGHTAAGYREPGFRSHLAGGMEWAAGHTSSRQILVEFDGKTANGTWDRMNPRTTDFPFSVSPSRLTMTADSGANQHVVRRGTLIDATRPHGIECNFTIADNPVSPVSSFALNFSVKGGDGDAAPISAWSINLDNRAIKHMGFEAGMFRQIGSTAATWQKPDTEYLMRVRVHQTNAGVPRPNTVAVTILQGATLETQFEVDYSTFPYQPTSKLLRLGANSHGANWTLRNLRAFYLD